MSPSDVRHISIAIQRAPQHVYEYASNPTNLPRWAHGLAGAIKQVGSEWVASSPMGAVRVRFAEPNDYGVLDHDVTLPSGVTVHNAMRVVPRSGGGSEVLFTLFRQSDVSGDEFEADASAVARDLRALKDLLE